MVRLTLDRMAAGGIFDHLGGGFHRYSVDAAWQVPHFEKMLYDNALLPLAYLEAWQITGNGDYAGIACQTLDYVLRDLSTADGGFAGAEDADSEAGEGGILLWTPDEILAALGPERAADFCRFYGVTQAGNFEGRNILHRSEAAEEPADRERNKAPSNLERNKFRSTDRCKLFGVRMSRPRPQRDDKVLVGWNGLLIEALARTGAGPRRAALRRRGNRGGRFPLRRLRDPAGRLLHAWRRGPAPIPAYLDDYANLANALIALSGSLLSPQSMTRPSSRWSTDALAVRRSGGWLLLHRRGPDRRDRPQARRVRQLVAQRPPAQPP